MTLFKTIQLKIWNGNVISLLCFLSRTNLHEFPASLDAKCSGHGTSDSSHNRGVTVQLRDYNVHNNIGYVADMQFATVLSRWPFLTRRQACAFPYGHTARNNESDRNTLKMHASRITRNKMHSACVVVHNYG